MISTKTFPILYQQLAESHQMQWILRYADQKSLREALTAEHRKERAANAMQQTEDAWGEMLNRQACEHIELRAVNYDKNGRLREQQKHERANLRDTFYDSAFPFFMIGAFL